MPVNLLLEIRAASNNGGHSTGIRHTLVRLQVEHNTIYLDLNKACST